MVSISISALVLLATILQAKAFTKDVGDARRSAMDWWAAEDQLVGDRDSGGTVVERDET